MEYEDVVYGKHEIPPGFAAIIASKVFQRLKGIRQLGLMDVDLPLPFYSRYEHCIGTFLCADRMLKTLIKNSPQFDTDDDIPIVYRNAVLVAALLHDIGHGPFSHSWELVNEEFKHEKNALPCVDAIFAEVGPSNFPELRDDENYGIELVKALIIGDRNFMENKTFASFQFIFMIVNNFICELDVDKWDYLHRDVYYLRDYVPAELKMDFDDVFNNARASADGAKIEYLYSDYEKMYNLFVVRWQLHMHCYHLPKSIACNKLLSIMVKRCPTKLDNHELQSITASQMSMFLKLTDETVLKMIEKDTHYKYFKSPNLIVPVALDEVEEFMSMPAIKLFYLRDIIPGPGIKMPQDGLIPFYGDPETKKKIDRDTNNYDVSKAFILH